MGVCEWHDPRNVNHCLSCSFIDLLKTMLDLVNGHRCIQDYWDANINIASLFLAVVLC